MPITATTYACDRDATQGQSTGLAPPAGWIRISSDNVSDQGVSLQSGFLCPQCAAAFVEFMTAAGGGDAFKPKQSAAEPAPAT
jgi:hypothetical protein